MRHNIFTSKSVKATANDDYVMYTAWFASVLSGQGKKLKVGLKNHSQEYKKRAEPVFTGCVNEISYQFRIVWLLFKGNQRLGPFLPLQFQ